MVDKNFLKPILEKIEKMSLHEKRIRYCQLAPRAIEGQLDIMETVEYTTLIEFLKIENGLQ
jgi:hypothetical protein